jgi:hypothetical protein
MLKRRQRIPSRYRWLFWDVDFARLGIEADRRYILPRVLEFGGMDEVRWLISTYGLDGIHHFMRDVGHPELSDRTIYFWRAVFRAHGEKWASPPDWRKSRIAPWID